MATSTALFVQSHAGQGAAAPGNAEQANFLVVVTDPITGEPITTLTQKNFQIVNHYLIPGQTCGFTNNITSFNNPATGAYQLQVKLKGCKWVAGDYLAQVIVKGKSSTGQATVKLSVR